MSAPDNPFLGGPRLKINRSYLETLPPHRLPSPSSRAGIGVFFTDYTCLRIEIIGLYNMAHRLIGE